MRNRKHYIVIENPDQSLSWKRYLIVPEGKDLDPKKYYSGEETLEEAQAAADRYNARYYVSDYADDEIEDFYQKVSFEDIEAAINERLGLHLTFRHSLEKSRDGWKINFKSEQDLCELNFMLARMLKTCHLENFGSNISVDSDTGELFFWLDINWTYTHHSLGSNGCDFVSIVFTEREGLKITFEEDRRKGVD